VTLSACRSAADLHPTEGCAGFGQAFLLAGARSLLMSTWSVDDRATALLMVRFYSDRLERGMHKAAALDGRERWLRALTRDQAAALAPIPMESPARGVTDRTERAAQGEREHPFDHPYYWASFVLVGDPE